VWRARPEAHSGARVRTRVRGGIATRSGAARRDGSQLNSSCHVRASAGRSPPGAANVSPSLRAFSTARVPTARRLLLCSFAYWKVS
jgi:hypothetical protein